jgi:DNA-binding NarL/FixJ family response regulator
MTATIAVLLVDDHALVRRGFRRLLEDDPSITVVGEASDGEDAIRLAGELKPGVVVMDVAMPGLNGLAATRAILTRDPDAKILLLSMHAEETLVREAMAAVKRVAAGDIVVDPAVAPPALGTRKGLTPRELEVLQLICNGLSNRAIAAELALSANTVAVHRANIMNTLGVHKTAELVVYAIRNGLVNPL